MLEIGQARPEERDQLADLYARVFFNDPVWSALVPDNDNRAQFIADSFLEELAEGGTAHVDVIRDEKGRVVGALNYQTPDGSSHALSAARQQANSESRSPWMDRSDRHEGVVAAFHPTEAHWYLRDLATDPSVRGQGYGSALLSNRIRIADAERLPVFLESTTEASRRLYERHGFKVVGEISELEGTHSFAMVRPAAQ